MKAGQALGLLAGMGALSALGRGADLKGSRFTGLLDMIDGGGGGKSGDRFEGGGLLSMLGNLFAKPYEAQQRVEDIAARASTRSGSPKPVLRPNMTLGTPITEYSDSLMAPIIPTVTNTAAMEDANLPAKQYSGRGNMYMPREGMQYSGRGTMAGSPEMMTYSGRGNVGMEGKQGLLYSGRGTMAGANPPVEYSGRGASMGGPALEPYVGPVPVADMNDTAMMDQFINDLLDLQPDAIQELDQSAMQDLYITYVQNGGKFY